jgi:hypothetical protein
MYRVSLGESSVTMLDSVTLASFTECLGTPFQLDAGEALALDLTLIEATATAYSRRANGEPSFSLIFRGPMRPILFQQIYRLNHRLLGVMELFLVPIGPDQTGMGYQVIFN